MSEADDARESAEAAARSTAPFGAYRDVAETEAVLHDAERAVMRRLICAARGIDEAFYWRLVEQEIRK